MTRPVKDIVSALEQALTEAKRGKIQNFIIIGLHDDGKSGSAYYVKEPEDAMRLVTKMTFMVDRMFDHFVVYDEPQEDARILPFHLH